MPTPRHLHAPKHFAGSRPVACRPACRRPARRRPARGGFAMLIVMVVLIAMLGMAAVHQRRLSAALRIEEAVVAAEERHRGPLFALARALEVAETGTPPSNLAVYGFQFVPAGQTQQQAYAICYTRAGSQWTVDVQRIDDASSLPPLPAHF